VEKQCNDPKLMQCGLEKCVAADGTVEWVAAHSKARLEPQGLGLGLGRGLGLGLGSGLGSGLVPPIVLERGVVTRVNLPHISLISPTYLAAPPIVLEGGVVSGVNLPHISPISPHISMYPP